jgi:hypothetical protein
MRIGSEAHKDLFCRLLTESFREFEPDKLPWPDASGHAGLTRGENSGVSPES